jgi:hypothetical protein
VDEKFYLNKNTLSESLTNLVKLEFLEFIIRTTLKFVLKERMLVGYDCFDG